jgi:hypothetical protein
MTDQSSQGRSRMQVVRYALSLRRLHPDLRQFAAPHVALACIATAVFTQREGLEGGLIAALVAVLLPPGIVRIQRSIRQLRQVWRFGTGLREESGWSLTDLAYTERDGREVSAFTYQRDPQPGSTVGEKVVGYATATEIVIEKR